MTTKDPAPTISELPELPEGQILNLCLSVLRDGDFPIISRTVPVVGELVPFLRAYVLADRAARRSTEVWQPIETAPKDGGIALYWVASVKFVEDVETGNVREIDVSAADFGCWMPPTGGGDGYHDPFGGIPGDQGGVTHWQPVPLPPAPTGAAEEKGQES